MSPQSLIAAGGILFGLLLVTALLVRRGGVRRGNRLLAAFLGCTLAYLLALIILRQGWDKASFLVPLLAASYLLSPPLLLAYVRSLINPARHLRLGDAVHLIPAVCLLMVVNLGDGGGVGKEAMESARGGWPPNRISIAGILIYLVQSAYFGRALLELQIHRQRVSTEFSFEEHVTLRWLRILVGISLLLALAGLAIALVRLVPGVELWPRSIYSMSAVLLVYYLIGFMGMSQSAIFTPRESSDATEPPEPLGADRVGEEKYETSSLTSEATSAYWLELRGVMERDKPYLDSQLRIADLAARLDMPVHYLSQTINQCARQSFFEFINSYRVETAKDLLVTRDTPISQVALEAGFNSDSAFYRHFKKVSGHTPKKFRRMATQQNPS